MDNWNSPEEVVASFSYKFWMVSKPRFGIQRWFSSQPPTPFARPWFVKAEATETAVGLVAPPSSGWFLGLGNAQDNLTFSFQRIQNGEIHRKTRLKRHFLKIPPTDSSEEANL